MWIVTTRGFYSLVAHRDLPDQMILRARVKGDLSALEPMIPDVRARMWRDAKADYPWRVIIDRQESMVLLARLAGEVDYGNFKAAVGRKQGRARENVYHRVWNALTYLEPNFTRRYYGAWKGWMSRDDEYTGFDPIEEEDAQRPLFDDLFEDIKALPETTGKVRTSARSRGGKKKKRS